ncbi:uncharacterized protein sS8_4805 [Methylocaldum marinum]|uniref:Uncharacterized protein n=1 Tax=Methylocaldum marinum TaxID=1432792 RepID=A0A250KYH8_9GAMM|nr:hypothetical protein [Methylocaldum marinum]BBA36728.1 uncharacterized protein sS8_4805 [Methylocaldum marinum]
MLNRLLLIGMLGLPVAAWAFFKPFRVVAPELTGLSCIHDNLCTDDVSRSEETVRLYDEALHFVNASVGLIENGPRVIFCSSDACFQSFGLEKRSAATIGTFGVVISPRAWKPYYVRHEMIHHLQNERLGTINTWIKPQWFTEGMAYSLSEDPRPTLSEPFEKYRSRFEHWYKQVGRERLWTEAGKL